SRPACATPFCKDGELPGTDVTLDDDCECLLFVCFQIGNTNAYVKFAEEAFFETINSGGLFDEQGQILGNTTLITPPIIKDSRTCAGFRDITNQIPGADIAWDGVERRVDVSIPTIIYGDGTTPTDFHTIKLWIDNPIAEVNGETTQVDPTSSTFAAFIDANDSTQAPVRFISENSGAKEIKWLAPQKTAVFIYDVRECGCAAVNRIGRFEVLEEGSETEDGLMRVVFCGSRNELLYIPDEIASKPAEPTEPPPFRDELLLSFGDEIVEKLSKITPKLTNGFAKVQYNQKNVLTYFEYLPDMESCPEPGPNPTPDPSECACPASENVALTWSVVGGNTEGSFSHPTPGDVVDPTWNVTRVREGEDIFALPANTQLDLAKSISTFVAVGRVFFFDGNQVEGFCFNPADMQTRATASKSGFAVGGFSQALYSKNKYEVSATLDMSTELPHTFYSGETTLYILDKNLELLGEIDVGATITSALNISNGLIIFSGEDDAGAEKLFTVMDSPNIQRMQSSLNSVVIPATATTTSSVDNYQTSSGLSLNSVVGDPVPGAEIYIEQEPNDEPVAPPTDGTSTYLLGGSSNNILYCYNNRTLTKKWSVNLGNGASCSPFLLPYNGSTT
ncbi:MAG: hypothetical protein KAH30_04840, partial [Caldisericia bacterium]|nr:hypothetical protein [Caldisericia bacterium]